MYALLGFKLRPNPLRSCLPLVSRGALKKDSYVMTEKLITIDKNKLGENIGVLTGEQMIKISRQLAKLLEIHKEDIP
jgi:mRNA interferase MazF